MPFTREKDGNAVRYLSDSKVVGWQYDKKRKKWFTWGIDVLLNGSRFRKKGFADKTEAERAAMIYGLRNRERLIGINPAQSLIKLSALFNKVISGIVDKDRLKFESRVLNYFLALTGDISVQQLTQSHFHRFVERRGKEVTNRNTTITPPTLHRELTIISSALNRAPQLFSELESYQPPRIPRLKLADNRRTRITTPEEKAKLLEYLTQPPQIGETPVYYDERIRIAHALRFAWLTGARKKEAALLKWKDYDERRETLRVYRYKNKLTSVFSPVPKRIVELFDERRALSKGEFVFTDGGQFSRCYFNLIVQSACESAGMIYGRFHAEGFTFHSARHDFITNLLRRGVDIETARELAGISKSEILLLYAHASSESRKRAVLIIDDF